MCTRKSFGWRLPAFIAGICVCAAPTDAHLEKANENSRLIRSQIPGLADDGDAFMRAESPQDASMLQGKNPVELNPIAMGAGAASTTKIVQSGAGPTTTQIYATGTAHISGHEISNLSLADDSELLKACAKPELIPPDQMRILVIGESPCAWSPIFRHSLYQHVECPGGYRCQLNIHCTTPINMETNSSILTDEGEDHPKEKSLLAGYRPGSVRHVLERECASQSPPHIVLIHVGMGDALYNPAFQNVQSSLEQAKSIVQNVTRWGSCAQSITFSTPDPIQNVRDPRFNWPDAWPGAEIIDREKHLESGLQKILSTKRGTCPSADFWNMDKSLWNASDYVADPLHYCRDVLPSEKCGTSTRVGARLAESANAKLKELAALTRDSLIRFLAQDQRKHRHEGSLATDGEVELRVWLQGDTQWEDGDARMYAAPGITCIVNGTGNVTSDCSGVVQCATGFEQHCSRLWVLFFVLAGLAGGFHALLALVGRGAVDESQPQRLRLVGLDGMRFVGALHILCYHLLYPTCSGVVSCTVLNWGRLWVQWFFVLSGFVTMRTEMGKTSQGDASTSLLELLARRLRNMYPLYIIGLLLDPRVWGLLTMGQWGQYLVMTHMTMLQSWIPPFATDPPNGPAWFVSCLFAFWLMSPLWVRLLKQTSTHALFSVLAGCCAYGVLLQVASALAGFHFSSGTWYGLAVEHVVSFTPLGNWHYFVAGAAAAVTTHRLGSCFSGWRWATALSVSVLFCCTGALATTDHPLLLEKGVWTLPMWLCLLTLLADPSCPLAVASARLAPTAVLSYPLYILHIPLIQMLSKVLPQGLDNSTWHWLPEICIVVAMAAAINKALEASITVYERRKFWKSGTGAL